MLKYLVQKEFIQIRRNTFLPRMIVIFPLMILLVLPFAANFEIRNINLAVVDRDRSALSTRLVAKVASSGYFRISGTSDDDAGARGMIELGTADIALEIPTGFERDIVRGSVPELLISADTVNGTKGGLGGAYLSSVIQDFSADLRADAGPTPRIAMASVSAQTQYRYNPHLSYPAFMIPALMVMGLLMITGFLPALNIVGEKEAGTIESMNVTPVGRFTFILSKLIPYWVIGFVVLSILCLLAALVWGLVPAGSILTIYLMAFLFVLAISGFGLLISNYAKTYQQAMFMMFFFVMIFNFLSGLFTPVASMPAWARLLSHGSPLRYMMEVLRSVYLRGSGIADLLPQCGSLLALATFFNTWAIASYRKTA